MIAKFDYDACCDAIVFFLGNSGGAGAFLQYGRCFRTILMPSLCSGLKTKGRHQAEGCDAPGRWCFKIKTLATPRSHRGSRPPGSSAAAPGRRWTSRNWWQQLGIVERQRSLDLLVGEVGSLLGMWWGSLLGRLRGKLQGGRKGRKRGHCQSCELRNY